jgi:hypothetical protein
VNRVFLSRAVLIALSTLALSVAYEPAKTEALMAGAAGHFVESLDRMQAMGTVFKFDSPQRTAWHYFPEPGFTDEYGYVRNGITFHKMNPKQRHFAYGLLSSGLGRAGFGKAMNVMALEEIVRAIEDDHTGYRDADSFHFSVFGEPSLTGDWAWRVEGHHLSLHYLIKNGELVSASPTFFGANPHESPQGLHKGFRALSSEEDLARALIKSLDASQRKTAIFDKAAPYDIITMADDRAKLDGDPQGLAASEVSDKHYEQLLDLVAEYAYNMPPEVAARRMKMARETPREKLFFGWAGDIERAAPQPIKIGSKTTENRHIAGNYYRIQSPEFLIEYANTQNQANHSHSVWREFDGDFGYDVMAAHYKGDSHGPRSAVDAD